MKTSVKTALAGAILAGALMVGGVTGCSTVAPIYGDGGLLALGDSYTIGESVAVGDRWPAQLAELVREDQGGEFAVQYIARTGWTTGDLLERITRVPPEGEFDRVSLLIGVNNQFRGQDFARYEQEVPQLVDAAVGLAGGDPERVFIVSIPDYAYTPYGAGLSAAERERISREIDDYNSWMEGYAASRGIAFVWITAITRRGLDEPELVASDGLHPSGAAYREFAGVIYEAVF